MRPLSSLGILMAILFGLSDLAPTSGCLTWGGATIWLMLIVDTLSSYEGVTVGKKKKIGILFKTAYRNFGSSKIMPLILSGSDIVAMARTGSEKTIALHLHCQPTSCITTPPLAPPCPLLHRHTTTSIILISAAPQATHPSSLLLQRPCPHHCSSPNTPTYKVVFDESTGKMRLSDVPQR